MEGVEFKHDVLNIDYFTVIILKDIQTFGNTNKY